MFILVFVPTLLATIAKGGFFYLQVFFYLDRHRDLSGRARKVTFASFTLICVVIAFCKSKLSVNNPVNRLSDDWKINYLPEVIVLGNSEKSEKIPALEHASDTLWYRYLYLVFLAGFIMGVVLFYWEASARNHPDKELKLELQLEKEQRTELNLAMQALFRKVSAHGDILFPEVDKPSPINQFLMSNEGTRLKKMNIRYAIKWLNYLKKKNQIEPDCLVFPSKITIDLTSDKMCIHPDFLRSIPQFRFFAFFVSFKGQVSENRHIRHANAVVIDNAKKTIERFEPHGKCACEFHAISENKFLNFLKICMIDYTYVDPIAICVNRKGPQTLQKKVRKEIPSDKIGYCTVWSAMYVHIRMQKTCLTLDEIYVLMCSHTPTTLLKHVTNYSHIVDKVLDIQSSSVFLPAEQTKIFEEAFRDQDHDTVLF